MVWEVQLWKAPESGGFTIFDTTVVAILKGGGRTTFLDVFKPEQVGEPISHKALCQKLYPFIDIFPLGSVKIFDHTTESRNMPYLYPGLVCETVIDPKCTFMPIRCNNWMAQSNRLANYQIMLIKLLSGFEWTSKTLFTMRDDTKVLVTTNKMAAVVTWVPQAVVIGESSWCGGVGWKYGLLVRTDDAASELPIQLNIVQTKRKSMEAPVLNSVRGTALHWPSLTEGQLGWAAGFEAIMSARGVTKFMVGAKEVMTAGRASVVSFAPHLDSLLVNRRLFNHMETKNVGMVRAKRGCGKTFFIYSAAKAAALSGKRVVLLVGPNALMDATAHLRGTCGVSICTKLKGRIVWSKNTKPEIGESYVFLADNVEDLFTKSSRAMSGVWTSHEVEDLANNADVVVLSVLMDDKACISTLSTHMLRILMGLTPFLSVWRLNPVVSSFVHSNFGLERIAPRKFQTKTKDIEFESRVHQREWSVNPMFKNEQQCVSRVTIGNHPPRMKKKICDYICKMWFSDTTPNERKAQTMEILNGITHFSTRNMKRKHHFTDPLESMFGPSQNSPRKRQKHFETHEKAKTLFSYLSGSKTTLECPICYEPQNAQVVVFSECRHHVCPRCVGSMHSANTCPTCRTVSQTEVLKRSVGGDGAIEPLISAETETFEKILLAVLIDAIEWATRKGPTLLVSKKSSVLRKMIKLVGGGGIPFSKTRTYQTPDKEWAALEPFNRFCVCNIDEITGRNIQAFTGVIVVGSLLSNENSDICNHLSCGPQKKECCVGYIMPRGLKSKLL